MHVQSFVLVSVSTSSL